MARTAGYEERSEKLRRKVEAERELMFAEARESIHRASVSAVSTITNLMDRGGPEDNVKLGAAKHILKLCGFETENINLNGSLFATLTITPEHAEKVRAIAKP